MTRPCPTCGGTLAATTSPGGQHRSGPVTATADARTLHGCRRGCREPMETQLSQALAAAIDEGLVLADGPRTEQRCGRCRTGLELPMRATLRSITVEPRGEAPFTVTFALPVTRCGGCGLDNVPTEVVKDLRRSALASCDLDAPRRTDARGCFRRLRRRAGRGSP